MLARMMPSGSARPAKSRTGTNRTENVRKKACRVSRQLLFTCNRCDVERRVATALETTIEPSVPAGWQIVNGKLICDDCGRDLGAFLGGARIEHIQDEREA
jgi:hypothetical protein